MNESLIAAAAIGFIVGQLWNTIVAAFKSREQSKERQILLNKVLAGGDPAVNYNLNLVDEVTKAPQAVAAAVEAEVRQKTPDEEIPNPWDDHPDYEGCEVSFDTDRGQAMIFNPNAADGPDCWEEKIEVFMDRLENND